MKDISKSSPAVNSPVLPFALAQSMVHPTRQTHRKLAGFAKVLTGGRVVALNNSKPFADRMLADGASKFVQPGASPHTSAEQMILESVATNLEAGVKLLDKQELVLAQVGGRLSEMALALNQARSATNHALPAQQSFENARGKFQELCKTTFDHTALFSNGPSKPITVAVPCGNCWEGLSIDRCDIRTPGLQAIGRGKVSPSAEGLLLDPGTISQAFSEWRTMCVSNRMQWGLISEHWQRIVVTLKYFLGGRKWTPPPFPDDAKPGPLRRPHLQN